MTVQDLIAALSALEDQSAEVLVQGEGVAGYVQRVEMIQDNAYIFGDEEPDL